MISWKSTDGTPIDGVLHKPADYLEWFNQYVFGESRSSATAPAASARREVTERERAGVRPHAP